MTTVNHDGDLVLGFQYGDAAGPSLPPELAGVPASRLRIVDGVVIDVADRPRFFIDEHGRKHAVQSSPEWQDLACAWDDVLAMDGATWRVAKPEDRERAAWDAVRQRRDQLLRACDWTQLADVPKATRERWAAYRQALRDIPQTYESPAALAWPEP
ncbi:tail fiber assembly protein [Microvirga solisilvae]|uniref:tail fiber assembly protein n=1 Tax=Microvirga solisilvae TaxID=2919498 RepID=UPI001FAF5720|nr:tail fiber assembly protein [Microvirga solisilvae]